MVMSYFDRFSLDSHLLLKKVEIEFGVTTINSDGLRDKWLLNCYTVPIHINIIVFYNVTLNVIPFQINAKYRCDKTNASQRFE